MLSNVQCPIQHAHRFLFACCRSAQPNCSPRQQQAVGLARWRGVCLVFSHKQTQERKERDRGAIGEGARAEGEPDQGRGCVSPVAPVRRGMQTSDGWCKSCVVWAMWMLYVCFAMALTLGRSDGPSGQGFSSLRVESLLSKMTLEDKVGSFARCLRSLQHKKRSFGCTKNRVSSAIFHPILCSHCCVALLHDVAPHTLAG